MSDHRISIRAIHVVPAISEEASGPSYSVVRLCESLITQREKVRLAALDWAPIASPPLFLKTFPLGLGPRRLGRSPAMHEALKTSARSESVDLIHNHSLWMLPNVYPGKVAQRYHIPLVVSPRGTLSEPAMRSGAAVKRLFWPLVQRPALATTRCFHATAKSEYEDIRRMGFRQPVAVIPNGIDIPDLPRKKHGDLRTLLFLGRVHPIKGVDVLLSAWQVVQARFPEWRLKIVGPDNGGYLARMKRLAAELSLARVEFIDPLFGKQRWLAQSESDLFVLPTYSENFGMTVAEALATGTPAIVTKGAPWAGLETHRAGWWIEIGIDSLVACLEEALAHTPETLAGMGLRGRHWMEMEFSWAEVGMKMADTYRWILNGGKKPGWVIEG